MAIDKVPHQVLWMAQSGLRLTSAAYPNEPVASNAGEVGVRVKARSHGAEVREDPPGRTRGPSPG